MGLHEVNHRFITVIGKLSKCTSFQWVLLSLAPVCSPDAAFTAVQ